MALLGGGVGGVGNPVGGSFTGPAEALEIIGDHAYAYSGMFEGSNTSQQAFNFTTGNYYFVGDIQVNMAYEYDASGTPSALATQLRISLNDNNIAQLIAGLIGSDSQVSVSQPVIIPPYTKVVVDIVGDANESTRLMGSTMTGRIYRTRD